MHVDCLCACACMNCRWCCMCVCCAELLFAAAATLISSINHAYRSRYWHPIIRYTTTTSTTTTATMTLNAAVSWSAFKLPLSLSVHGRRRSVRHESINAGIVLIAVRCRWVHIVVVACSDVVLPDQKIRLCTPTFWTVGSPGSTNFCDICSKLQSKF